MSKMRMAQKHFFTLSLAVLAMFALSACTTNAVTQPASLTPKNPIDVKCLWGTSQFDVCRSNKKEEIVSALVKEMTLDEKIGQMTQSVWHNKVTP